MITITNHPIGWFYHQLYRLQRLQRIDLYQAIGQLLESSAKANNPAVDNHELTDAECVMRINAWQFAGTPYSLVITYQVLDNDPVPFSISYQAQRVTSRLQAG